MAKELASGAIPTLKEYWAILKKLFSGDFKEAGKEAWGMTKEAGRKVGNAIDTATGHEQGTLASTSIMNKSTSSSPVSGGGGLAPRGGNSPQDKFISKYWSTAVAIGKKLNVPTEIILGQFALETRWGQGISKGTGYNLHITSSLA